MSRIYNVIDADGHVLEPADLWLKYVDAAYRERAPQIFIDSNGEQRLRIDGRVVGQQGHLGRTGAIRSNPRKGSPYPLKYEDGEEGGFDPHARVKDLDVDGIDAAFLYPTLGLFAGAVEDPGAAAAFARAYNRWIADYCTCYPDRLFGVAMIPLQSIDLAMEEMRFARDRLGLRAGFIRPNPYCGRLLSDPAYDPLWAVAQDRDFAIGIHEVAGGGMPAVGVDRVVGRVARHIAAHTIEMMLASLNLIWSGVCERFPKLRFAFLESGGGWMAPWLERMDRHFHQFREAAPPLPPSEYFRRQCWISFEPVESCLPLLVDKLGATNILWATDYPHHDGFFPGAPKMIAEMLPEQLRRKVLAEGAMNFYKLN